MINGRRLIRAARNRRSPVRRISRDQFADELGFDALHAPADLVVLGRKSSSRTWLASYQSPPGGGALGHREDPIFTERRIWALARFLRTWVQPHLPDRSFWTLVSVHDGWREFSEYSDRYHWVDPEPGLDTWRGGAGELPRISQRQPWQLCFSAHKGDPSGVLVPEAAFLLRGDYREVFATVRSQTPPWHERRSAAVFHGGDHGHPWNVLRHQELGVRHARELLARVVDAENLDVEVKLGGAKFSSYADQLKFRYLIDVDGYARTYDAWAWKMASGSVVLAQESIWHTLFTDQFTAWEHFVPVANDFADLAQRLEWCRANDRECREIAERAAVRAAEVYRPEAVAALVVSTLSEMLFP